MTAILRSSMSVMRESVSEPTSRTGPEPMAMRPATVTRPYTKPEQAAFRSNAPPLHADPVLHARRRARDDAVGGGRGQDQVVDLGGGPPGAGQGLLGRLDGQARGRAADVALADAGALDDPLVTGVEVDRHVVVGDDLVRYGDAPTGDPDPRHAADPERTAWMPTNPASP